MDSRDGIDEEAAPARRSAEDPTSGDEQIVSVTKALGHEVRLDIIRTLLEETTVSPVKFAATRGVKVGKCAYHFKILRKSGLIRIVSVEPRRGAAEHIHALGGPNVSMALSVLEVVRAHPSNTHVDS